MAGNQDVGFIDENGIREAEFPYRLDDLFDLSLRVGPGIARIRLQRGSRSVDNRQLILAEESACSCRLNCLF